jgi:hypothetical protein
MVWAPGDTPRAVARLFTPWGASNYALGAPSPASVPLLIYDREQGWAWVRDVSLAPPPGGTVPYVPVEGWVRADGLARPESLPACSTELGMTFDLGDAPTFGGELDGTPIQIAVRRHRLRWTRSSGCIDALTGTIERGDPQPRDVLTLNLASARGEVREQASDTLALGPGRAVTCALRAK